MLKHNNFRKKNKGGNRKGTVPKSELMLNTYELKPFHPTPKMIHTFRYQISTAITGQTVTCVNIFAAWVLAISSSALKSIIGNMRIIHVAATAATSTFDQLFIRDANQQGVVDPVDSTSITGVTNVMWKPNSKSLASDWFNYNTQSGSSAASLFTMSLPVNAILELKCQIVLGGAAGTISGANYTGIVTQGYMYSMGLDGAPASIYYTPLGMNAA